MNRKTQNKMVLWLQTFPDSHHPLDTDRLYDFVREACIHDDEVDEGFLRKMVTFAQPKWSNDQIDRFVDENIILIEHLMSFYDFCINDEHINTDKIETYYFAKNIRDFMDAVGDLNYHEIYELYQAIEGHGESLTFFEVEDKHDYRTIKYTIMNVAFSFPIDQVKSLKDWLEEHYMDGLDAESWYGYRYAMERSEDE